MAVIFIIVTLKPGVDADVYEAFVREHDRGFARRRANFTAYSVHRISGPIKGAESAQWRYVERLEVESLEQYARDLESPAGRALISEIEDRFVDASKTIAFTSDIVA